MATSVFQNLNQEATQVEVKDILLALKLIADQLQALQETMLVFASENIQNAPRLSDGAKLVVDTTETRLSEVTKVSRLETLGGASPILFTQPETIGFSLDRSNSDFLYHNVKVS